MCLIVHRPKGAPTLREEWIMDFHQRNDDGFGIFWLDKDGVLNVRRTLAKNEIVPLWREAEQADVEFGAHFRMATHGARSLENVHPYVVFVEKKGSEVPVCVLAHNGILSQFGGARGVGLSDTYYFIHKAFAPIAGKWGMKETFKDESDPHYLVETLISGSKLLVADNEQGFKKFGPRWEEFKGLSLSNTYAWNYARRAAEVPADSTPFRQGDELEDEVERVEYKADGHRIVAYRDGTVLEVPPGIVIPRQATQSRARSGTSSLTNSSSTGQTSMAFPSGNGRSYASEYGRVFRLEKSLAASKSSEKQQPSEAEPSSPAMGQTGQSSSAANSNRKERANKRKKPSHVEASLEQWEDMGDLSVTGDTYATLSLLAGQPWTEVYNWVISEPEEATNLIQEMCVASFKV